jgi:magnesium transporter
MTNVNINYDLLELVRKQDWDTINTYQATWSTPKIIGVMQELVQAQRVMLFRLLEKDRAIEVFEWLDSADQTELVRAMTDPDALRLLESLDVDLRTRIFDELPAKVTKRLLAALSPEARQAVNVLLGYPEDSAGRIMNPRYLAVHTTATVAEALAAVKTSDLDADELRAVFVIEEGRFYQGFVSLGALVKGEPQVPIKDLLEGQDIFVRAMDKRLAAARLLKQYDLVALPVVDKENRLIGAVAFDDVIDVLEEEASETMYQKVGIVDLRRERDMIHSQKVTQGPIWYAVGLRITFLFVTVIGGLLVGSLIDQFSETLSAVIAAAAFIPIVMDMGGNVGTQSTTIFARGIALGHIQLNRFWWHAAREVSIGVAMGIFLGILTGVIAWLWQGIPNAIPQIGIAVGVAIFSVVTLATLLGFLLPWLLIKLGFDHAPGADPFITTIKDFVGLGLYFTLVGLLIGI